MPSGSKRRKAAKKKKETTITNPISEESQEHGNGDSPRSHDDDKDSDSGSASSPTTSQGHHNPLRDDEEEPHLEKSDVGGDGELDFVQSSRVVDIEPWKDSNVEIVKEDETSSNGRVENKIQIEIESNDDGVKDVAETARDLQKEPVSVNVVEKIGDVEAEDREEKVLPQSNGTNVEINNGGESQIPTSSNNQPKEVAPVPPVVRPASWKNCCGLFDVFMGSSR